MNIVRKNNGTIYKIASLYTQRWEDREDLVQEIVYQLWKSFDGFEERASVSTWLYRVAMNVAIHHLKLSKKTIRTVSASLELAKSELAEDSEEDQHWKLVLEGMKELNLLDRGILMLYLEGKNYREMSRILGISESNIGTKLSRIKKRLRKLVAKKENAWS